MTIDSSKLIPKTEAIKFKTSKLVNVYSRSNFLDNRYLKQNIVLKEELFKEKEELYKSLSKKQNDLGKDVKEGLFQLGILGTGGGIGLLSRLFKKGNKVPKVKITGDVLKNTKLPKVRSGGVKGGLISTGIDIASGTPADEAVAGGVGFEVGSRLTGSAIGAGLGFFIPDGPLLVAGEVIGGLVGGLLGEAAMKKIYRKVMGKEVNAQDVVDKIEPKPVVNHFDNSLTLYSKSIEMMESVNWDNLVPKKQEQKKDPQDKRKVDPQTPVVERGKDTITENNITEKEFHTTEITKIIEKITSGKEITVRERTLLVDNGINDVAVGGKTQSVVGDLVTLGACVAVKTPAKPQVIASSTTSRMDKIKNTISSTKKSDYMSSNNITPFNVDSGGSNVFFNQSSNRMDTLFYGKSNDNISLTEIIRQARTQ